MIWRQHRHNRRPGSGITRAGLLAFALLVGPLTGLALHAAGAADTPSPRFFAAATGHTVGDPFLNGWIAANGAESLGNPVTEPVDVGSKTRQYFEFGVLSRKSSKTTRVMAAKTLLALLVREHSPSSNGRKPSPIDRTGGEPVNADPGLTGVVWSDKTNHTASGAILEFYQHNGGSTRFGQPISESYRAGGVTVQWFEYGRLQLDLNGNVTSAPVGFELARLTGVQSDRVTQGGLPLFLTSRFASYQGDGTIPNAAAAFAPVEIMIPAISVDAKIEQVAVVDGVMGTPEDAWNVGWYPQISWPGTFTNVVMAGHRDWWGIGPTVFYNLPDLTNGEMIYLLGADGKGATYRVTDAYSVGSDTNAGDVVGDTGADILTLITCDGSFDGAEYNSRQIVRAQRI
jgi:LPXTG-site transpeptidase (sortase) family protein